MRNKSRLSFDKKKSLDCRGHFAKETWGNGSIHHTKTGTLNSNLEYAQQASKARNTGNFPTAGNILSASWKDQDIRKCRRSRCNTQEDEEGRYSERAPQLDNTDMLGEI